MLYPVKHRGFEMMDVFMSDPNIRVLEVMEVENQDDGWLVSGLTFDTIKVGDHLTVIEVKQGDTQFFKVMTITVFGRQIDEITVGYYARFLLNGTQGDFLRNTKYLYRVAG